MFCTTGTGKSSSSKSPRRSQESSSKTQVPLLLHFDVNKTVIQSDSVQMKGVEEGIREGIADLFWGVVSKSGGTETWEWIKAEPSCTPPKDDILAVGTTPLNYTQWCKRAHGKDKKAMKEAVRSFSLVHGKPVETEMKKLLQLTIKKMQLRPEVRKSKEAEVAGLQGPTFNMFPALFHLVAQLQRQRRPFGILFRSFGADHDKIQREWNAFCELRHPIFSRLIEDLGPMDGSDSRIPDRRIHSIHTVYRDAHGPMVMLDTFTNGPEDQPWDQWARTKPKPTSDSRNGKVWAKQVLKPRVVEGMTGFRKFCSDHLTKQATAAIKDDWAWWQFHSEQAHAGKLMTLLRRKESAQVFFDDNIEPFDARIVDCRDEYDKSVADIIALEKYLVKVNPVEAMLDENYFWRKLLATQGDHMDVGSSLIGVQKQLADVEEEKGTLQKQLANMGQQIKNLMEENRRMKQQRRIPVRDENDLHSILQKDGIDVKQFGAGRFKSLANLYSELDHGACWLQRLDAKDHDNGRIVRVLDIVYMTIKFQDMLLVESHEQDGSNASIIQTRNYLPGVRMFLKDKLADVLERWFQGGGLQVDIWPYIETEEMPVYVPDAPPQQSLLTEAYPISCLVQQSQGSFIIPDTDVQVYKDLFAKIGLPGGKSFSTTSKDPVDGNSITRLWRWEKIKNWKAHATSGQKVASQIQDVSETCRKLFRDHPRAEIYQRLLLQMFEVFEAQKLTGGFSGSLVIRVQPFEADGRPGEPCIVKFDEGKAIRTEASNSKNVFKALPDRAARILGDAVYGRDKDSQEEFGAMRLELAGACWNIPELAQGSSSLLSTFKDLLLYESEQMLLGSVGILNWGDDMRPFGNVNSVLAETFGPGGIVSSLRKGGTGLHRNIDKPLISGWYTLKGKDTKYNIFVAKKNEYPPEKEMRRLYREYFGSEPPNLRDLVVHHIRPKLEELAKLETGSHLCPLVGLAHGDLNAANIMIDALDAVWLIDFATSIELPLFTDMCKFEMACLFEYATIPITPKMLLEFASTQESAWAELNVGDWLRTDQKTAEVLLQRLAALPPERLSGLSQQELEKLIDEVVGKSGKAPHKQKALQRALLARLVAEQAFTESAFAYAQHISNALLTGDNIKESLEIRGVQLPEGRGARGAASLRFFMENLVSIRRFMLHDVMGVLREQSKKGQLMPVDSLSLQLWLPFLRESYRIIGYRDIAPQYKVWCIYHCNLVAKKVLSILEVIHKNIRNLNKLQQNFSIKDAMVGQLNNNDKAPPRRSDRYSTERAMQLTSHWVRSYNSLFQMTPALMKVIRKVHRSCAKYKDEPGFFAPVFQAQLLNGEKLCKLSFYDMNERSDADKVWELWLLDAKQMGNNGYTQSVKLGWVTGTKTEPEVVLSSRLVPLTDVFMRRKMEDLKDANSQEMKEILGSYVLQKWLELGNEDVRAQSKQRPAPGARNEEVDGFLSVNVVVKDRAGHDILPLEIIVGAPCYCYPPGSMLCVDPQAEVPNWAQRSPCVVIQNLTESAAAYSVRGSIPLTSGEGDGLAEFEPLPGNHTYLVPVKYPTSKYILFKQGNEASWMEGQIQHVPSAENQFCHVVKFLSGEKKDKEAPLHLDGMNSGIRVTNMTYSAYEEELSKIKGHFRARHSWIMDSLSGLRFNVKECAPPTLSTVAFLGGSTAKESMTTSMSISKLMRRSASAVSFGGSQSGPGPDSKDALEVKSGWQTVLSAVESYNLGQPSCNPNAFLVLGSPGSGKSCFVGRLMMEMLDRYENLIPLMLPVADLVKRSDPEGPDAYDAEVVQEWFDSYLRVTYGEDSLRYSMICQARSMSRVVFLFEGLEDAEKLTKAVESLIRVLVRAKNLVVVTSRPLLSGRSALENESELLVTMRLENLSDEQKRIVAYARLGAAGIDAYDNLLARLRTSQNVSDQGDESSNDGGAEDVFGNPMMLSMLLCYLQTMGRKSAEELEADVDDLTEESEETTLTAVYRVAVDVMLQRVQSRTQGDRLLVQERVDQSKQIMQKMAMAMQTTRRLEIRVEEVDGLLKPELFEVWTALKSAVSAGHAMFLRMTGEAGPREELRFLVKGFQNFFAASCVAAEGAEGLPDLKELLTDNWWQQMLEMLGEAWPLNYVEIVQSRLGQFKSTSKDNFLHIAARSGHRPIFQLLHRFPENHREKLNQRGEDGMLPLHLAAQTGHTLLIELMLKAGSFINAEDAGERLAVHIAMRYGHFQTAQFLNDRWLEIYGSSKTSERRSRKAEELGQRMVSLTEGQFLTVANETFTELGFFSQKESVDKKRTVGALLAVFWIVANQYDQFVRGQDESNRLAKTSWQKLQEWTRNTVRLTQSHAMVSAMLVYVAIMNVGKIKPFRAAFAPEEDESTEALARILHRSPILVPSFAKLGPEQQQIILSALKADFNFGQFLQAENLPASLFTVRQILQEGGEDFSTAASGDILGFFLFRIFAAMCGVAGANSLDGSIFMTETNYKNFEVGLDTLMHLMEDGAVKVYDRFLEARAKGQGLNFHADGNRDQRALVRLACMMRAFDASAGEKIASAWGRLEEEKRTKLVEFLNADGIKITPGFILQFAPNFLENAKKNEGNFPLEMTFQVLLQVYEAAAKEYAKSDQKVITIMVDALAEFSKTCKHTDVFQFVKFEIARTPGQKGEVMGNLVISPWQLVVDKHRLDALENEAGNMFMELSAQTGLKENVYLKHHLPNLFPELGFFRDPDENTKYYLRETYGRLLVVYWTATDQPEAFTRGQEIEKKLTESSWSKIREMTSEALENGEVFNAVLTAMAILDVAKLPKFRAQLAPHCASEKQVLADVLENWPQVLPSFVRMPQESQSLAKDCLTSEFIFAQFIWAEIPPASVTAVKTMLSASRKSLSGLMDKTKYLNVFLYCVFVEMSASQSQKLEGSLYMTEDRWKEFEVGKDAILRLEQESEQVVYDSILDRSAKTAGFKFDPTKQQSRALARLACMANITDADKGKKLEEAFNQMEEDQRNTLSAYLAADGIHPNQKPGFGFQDARMFLQQAIQNSEVGPLAALLFSGRSVKKFTRNTRTNPILC